jgi:adenylate cyclase
MDLRRKSFEVLPYLVERPGRVVTKEELIKAVWPDVTVGDESLTQCISEVGRALGEESHRVIKTVPRRGYLFDVPISANDAIATKTPNDASQPVEALSLALPLPDRASIAVLPLANLGHDSQLEYFADGIVEDIITDLSRFSELFVIARNSSFQYKGKLIDVRQVGRTLGVHYVLEGSIRCGGERVRVNLQLIDAQTGAHRWAERYDREIDEVFQVQDQVAHTVAALLAAHMSKAESERTVLKPPATWQAYDCYRRAADAYAEFHRPMEVASIYKARAFIGQCIAIDPNFARAYVLRSMTLASTWALPLDDDYMNPTILDAAHRAAEKAVQLDPNLPQAHYQLGFILSFKAQRDAAVAECERAVALNPSYTDWRFAAVLVHAGQPERAVDVAKAHLRIDPFTLPIARGWLGLAYYVLRKYKEALPPLREFVSQAPNFRPGRVWLAATFAQLGRLEEARAEAAEVLRIDPDWTSSSVFRKGGYLRDEDVDHLTAGAHIAGLPEK